MKFVAVAAAQPGLDLAQGRAGAEPTVVSFPSQQPVSPEPTGLPFTKHSGGIKRCELSDAGVFQTLFQHAAN